MQFLMATPKYREPGKSGKDSPKDVVGVVDSATSARLTPVFRTNAARDHKRLRVDEMIQ